MRIDTESAHRLHDAAWRDVAGTAERVPSERWLAPRGEGKWSPAEVIEHLTVTYDVLLRELAGGPGMAIRTKWWQRILLRFTMVPKILRGDGFPSGARAPRETRPVLRTRDQREALAAFREAAERFTAVTASAKGSAKITHAYFGKATVAQAVLFCARHLQHHEKQLDVDHHKDTKITKS